LLAISCSPVLKCETRIYVSLYDNLVEKSAKHVFWLSS